MYAHPNIWTSAARPAVWKNSGEESATEPLASLGLLCGERQRCFSDRILTAAVKAVNQAYIFEVSVLQLFPGMGKVQGS